MYSAILLLGMSFLFAENPTEFGKPELSSEPVKLTNVMNDFGKYKGKNLVMMGHVSKVCKMSGCWFELADADKSVRITMKDYGFTVPKDIINKNVKVSGTMEQKELPVKVVRHFMKDEGRPQAEIDQVTQPQKVFEFVATGVKIL